LAATSTLLGSALEIVHLGELRLAVPDTSRMKVFG